MESLEGTMEIADAHRYSLPAAQAETNDLTEVVIQSLSPRQKEIVKLDIVGHTQKQVATILNVSTKTILREQKSIAEIVRATRSEFNLIELSAVPKKKETRNSLTPSQAAK